MDMSTGDGAFTQRSIGKTIVIAIVTLGLYGLYWTWEFFGSLADATGQDNQVMRFVGLFIPLYNLYVMWQVSQDIEDVFDKGAGMMFALWLFLAPVWWYMIQSEINARAA